MDALRITASSKLAAGDGLAGVSARASGVPPGSVDKLGDSTELFDGASLVLSTAFTASVASEVGLVRGVELTLAMQNCRLLPPSLDRSRVTATHPDQR
ncbi:hypothetical protein HYDPIDRAFT_107653 [Hydnomerulius pinastri MD-312]|nr:hypothetical protein HYDPIDRAFT_107653 [Hydnomerulius pinastri MD-312]